MVPSNDQQRGVDVIVDDSISHSCSAKQGIRIGQNLWTPGRKKNINIPEMIGWDSSGTAFQEVKQRGHVPSNEALSGVVIRCAAARQWQEALQLLRQLRGKGSVPGIGDDGG